MPDLQKGAGLPRKNHDVREAVFDGEQSMLASGLVPACDPNQYPVRLLLARGQHGCIWSRPLSGPHICSLLPMQAAPEKWAGSLVAEVNQGIWGRTFAAQQGQADAGGRL